MKNSKIAKNYIFNLCYQSLLALVPLVVQPYAARTLGASALGIYGYTQSIVTYFVLIGTLGLSVYGQREIARFQDNIFERSKVFYELLLLKLMCVSLCIWGYLVLVFTAFHNDYRIVYLIQVLDLIATAFDITFFFQGLELFKKIAIRNMIVKGIGVFSIFIFVKEPEDLPIYILSYSLTLLAGNGSLWLFLRIYIEKIPFKNLNPLKHIRGTLWLFIPQIACSVYTVLDKTMIGLIIESTRDVGFYDCSQKIIYLLLTVITSMGIVMLPRVSNLYSLGSYQELKRLISASFSFVAFIAFPTVVAIMIIADEFSVAFWGGDFANCAPFLRVLCWIIIIVGFSNVTGLQYLVPTGREKKFTLSIVVGAVINGIANIILLNTIGTIGACMASVFAEFVILLIQIYCVRNEISFVEIFKGFWKIALSTIVFAVVLIATSGIIKVNGIFFILLKIMISCFFYFASLYILKEHLFYTLLDGTYKYVSKFFKQKN